MQSPPSTQSNLWLIIGHTPIRTRMSYSLPNLFLWARVRILALIAMLYFTMILALLGPYCNTLGLVDCNKTIGSRKVAWAHVRVASSTKFIALLFKWYGVVSNLDMLVRRVSKMVYRRGLPIPTQNFFSSQIYFCHVSCSRSLRPTCIPRGNHIPAHVKMK